MRITEEEQSASYSIHNRDNKIILKDSNTTLPSSTAVTREIIGGHEAEPHSRPYMAYLEAFDENPPKVQTCGGFLIREDVVMTAAHCHGSTIEVTLGAHNIQKQEKSKCKIPVSRAILHPNFDSRIYTNDIMLLKVRKNANLTKEVGLLSLPDSQVQLKPGQVCSVAGWGLLSPRSDMADTLQEVQLTLQMDQECKFHFPRNYNPAIQLCAGDPNRRKSTFKGDSGGPLVCNNLAQRIVSYGMSNGSPPRAYTRISSFLSWIRNTLRRM
ncbi:granzyme B(G,H)-like [Sorex fumeus]|uniref:granzyme B(G,H)-like n=1 Tax=Sorex fumeus TaxID=62283 RepID=UPI0024AE36BB|nr:granzyme B(G,H)-like [Sorex fumeus]